MGAAVEHWNQLVLDRLRNVSRETPDSRLVEELASHLSQAYDNARRNGRTPEEAQADAMRLLDTAAPLRQAVIAARPALPRRVETWVRQEPGETGGLMSRFGLKNDARYALRMLVRTPTFSAVAILTFAVAIGINTAVFTVVNGVLLRPLPYPDSDRITMIWMDNRPQGIREDITSYPNF